MAILEVKNLYKSFGKVEVLKGIDFSMEEGEIVSIIRIFRREMLWKRG